MLNNCKYDKIKLLHELSCLVWFIKNHAKKDAEIEGHGECFILFEELQKDLEEHIRKLHHALCD